MTDTMDNPGPHNEIERLEAQIDELAGKIESCRKFILAARVAMVGGGLVLVALLTGVIRFDPTMLALSGAALLIGIVVWGSNASTEKEAAAELAKAEANRKALIGLINLRVVAERPTLH
jgi:hypothetical protein